MSNIEYQTQSNNQFFESRISTGFNLHAKDVSGTKFISVHVLLDFSLTVAAPHECVIRTSQP